jgi:hypothetical protein
MRVQVGAARMMGDGSGDASVSVSIDGGRKRQVRVCSDMDDSWMLFCFIGLDGRVHIRDSASYGSPCARLIHPSAVKDCPPNFCHIQDPEAVRQILTAAREVMRNPKLQAGVLRSIRKRKERERKERVASCSIRLKEEIASMFRAGATHDEVMTYINEALVKTVQEA